MTLNLDDAMKDLLAGDEAGFQRRLKDVDPSILRGLYERSRELGRSLFIAAEYSEAIEKFTGALCIAPSGPDKAALFANRAACYLKLNRPQDALNEARKSIAMDSSFAKGWFRAGQALEALKNWAAAKSAYAQAAQCAGVDLSSPSMASNEIYHKWKVADEELIKSRQKRRYDLDYGRFESLIKDLTRQEEIEAQTQQDDGCTIEFAEGLTDEQKATLKAQLTGEVDMQELGLPFDGSGLRIRMDKESRKQECHSSQIESLLSVFQLQYEARYPDRLFGLIDSKVIPLMTDSLVSFLRTLSPQTSEMDNLVFIGYGSLLPILRSLQYLLASRLEMPVIHLISRGLCISANETLARMTHQTALKLQKYVHFHRDIDCFCDSSSSEPQKNENQPCVSSNPVGDENEENVLQNRGTQLLEKVSSQSQLPDHPSCCIIDLESIDPYLMGPRFPSLYRFYTKWPKCTFFPSNFTLKARLLELPESDLNRTPSIEKYLRWSLLPIPIAPELLRSCRLSAATIVTSFPSHEISYDQSQFAHFGDIEDGILDIDRPVAWTTNSKADAVLLYLTISDSFGDIIFDGLRDLGISPLQPHILWLNNTMGEEIANCNTVRFCVEKRMIIGAEMGKQEATGPSQTVEFKVHASSFPSYVIGSCDRHYWETSLLPSPRPSYGKALAAMVQKLRSTPVLPPQGRLHLVEAATSMTSDRLAEDLNIAYFDVGNIHHAMDSITALLRRRVGMDPLFTKEREVSLTLLDTSQGSVRLLRSLLSSSKCLEYIRKHCWMELPSTTDEWHHGVETKTSDKGRKEEETKNASDVRDWLFTYDTKNRQRRFRLQAGSVQSVRCLLDNETPETRMALCRLYGVPPGTPGLESRAGCIELPPLDLVVMGSPESLPLDCFASNFLANVLYLKEALLRKGGQIIPSAVHLYVTLIRYKALPGLEGVDAQPLRNLRCPVTPQQCGEMLYTTRSIISRDALDTFDLLSEQTKFLSISFAASASEILADFAKTIKFKVPSLPGADGMCQCLYISTVYDGVPTSATNEGLIQNVMPFKLQAQNEFEYSAVSVNCFKLTPAEQTRLVATPEDQRNYSSPATATLSMKEGELVRNLGQSLASSKEVVEQVANTCVACSALPCEEAMRDGRVMNNLLFAALS